MEVLTWLKSDQAEVSQSLWGGMWGHESGKQRHGRRCEDAWEGAQKQMWEKACGRGHCRRWGWRWFLEGGTVCQEVLQPMGDPHWSRDTPKGLQHVEDLGWRRGEQAKRKEQRKKTVRNKKQQQEDITPQPNLLSCLSPHPRGLQGGSVMGV